VKKAVITTGGKQYIVSEGESLDIELIKADKTVTFEPLMVIDGDKIQVGTPVVKGAKVSASVVEQNIKADKVTSIRYKAKKRVNVKRGHRQQHTRITIDKIA
jgi:large subunit ribosomal protein L21